MGHRWSRLVVLGLAVAAGCAPTVPRERIRFAALAGLYYSAAGEGPAEAALVEESEALVSRAIALLNATKDLDFVILAGDLFARPDALSVDRLRALLADLKVPYFVVLGDHDGPGPAGEGRAPVSRGTLIWTFQGRGFRGALGYWSHEVLPGLLLVGLDTAVPGGRAGRVDAAQLDWLARTLAASQDKAVLVFAHHGLVPLHPLDEGSAWRELLVENAEAVRQVLQRHPSVVLVMTGHHHFAAGRVSGQTLYLSAPSVSVWPLAYSLVQLTPRDAEAVWIPLAGEGAERRAQQRLLASETLRGVFPPGEDGDTACIRLFGGGKLETYKFPAIRP